MLDVREKKRVRMFVVRLRRADYHLQAPLAELCHQLRGQERANVLNEAPDTGLWRVNRGEIANKA
jgi:hypothetical protein